MFVCIVVLETAVLVIYSATYLIFAPRVIRVLPCVITALVYNAVFFHVRFAA